MNEQLDRDDEFPKIFPGGLQKAIHPSAWKEKSPKFAKKGSKNTAPSEIHRRFIALCPPETRSLQRVCQGA